jgi:hypothetical protein
MTIPRKKIIVLVIQYGYSLFYAKINSNNCFLWFHFAVKKVIKKNQIVNVLTQVSSGPSGSVG